MKEGPLTENIEQGPGLARKAGHAELELMKMISRISMRGKPWHGGHSIVIRTTKSSTYHQANECPGQDEHSEA